MFGPVAVWVTVTGVIGPSTVNAARTTPERKKTATKAMAADDAWRGTNGRCLPRRRATSTSSSQAATARAICHQCLVEVAQKQITPVAAPAASGAWDRASQPASRPTSRASGITSSSGRNR